MNNENILVKYDNVSISFDNGDNIEKISTKKLEKQLKKQIKKFVQEEDEKNTEE